MSDELGLYYGRLIVLSEYIEQAERWVGLLYKEYNVWNVHK